MAIRHIDLPVLRLATGAVRFGKDWPGVFIRGDEALGLANMIVAAQQAGLLPKPSSVMDDLVELLRSCAVRETA